MRRGDERIRVLVVDDSAFARKVLRELLRRRPEIEVVGAASDGLEALEQIDALRPDVVALDLIMPQLDGLGVLRALRGRSAPKVVVVSVSEADSDLGIAALEAGAVDVIRKPTALATDRLYDVEEELVAKVIAAAGARPRPLEALPTAERRQGPPVPASDRALVVGASTGGPQALTRLLGQLPGDLPVPVAVVLHIPRGYTEALARRLDAASALEIVEATDRIELRPGLVVVARAGAHLKLRESSGRKLAVLDGLPGGAPHCPSVDVLFASAAATYGAGVIGVVLTGMGSDGLEGARAVRRAGGRILTEAESTCVVYGMPGRVREAGLADLEVPIYEMGEAILALLREGC